MAAFQELVILFVVMWVHFSSPINDETPSTGLGPSLMNYVKRFAIKEVPIEESDYVDLGKAIDFSRLQITNVSNAHFKERVDQLLSAQKKVHGDGIQYDIIVRLNASQCKIDNSSCDPHFDGIFLPLKNETRIVAKLDPAMHHTKDIIVEGLIPIKSKGFSITIMTGYRNPTEAQLRINVKFSSKGTTIRLEYFSEGWNLYGHYKGFLETEKAFKVLISCLDTQFEILVNDRILDKVYHVLPYQAATHLSIFGNVTISKVTGIGPHLSPNQMHLSKYVPFVAPLVEPLELGKTITVKGNIPEDSPLFAIIIQSGPGTVIKKAQLRVEAKFSQDGKNTLSLFHRDGKWMGKQVVQPVLAAGRSFHIDITCRNDHFQISFDRKYNTSYYYRIPIEQATHLRVGGMVDIAEVVGVGELPRVEFYDKPLDSPYTVPIEDLPLTPGRSIQIWFYLTDEPEPFYLNIQGAQKLTNYALQITFKFNLNRPKLVFNTGTYDGKGNLGKTVPYDDVPWLKQDTPISVQIKCLDKSFQVTFNGLWTYYIEYRVPLKEARKINFSSRGWRIKAIAGLSASPPPLPPPPPPPQSRVCSIAVWSRQMQHEYWLKNFVCKPKYQISELGSQVNNQKRKKT